MKMPLVNVLVDSKHLPYVWNLQGQLAAMRTLPAKITVEAKGCDPEPEPTKAHTAKSVQTWTADLAVRAYRESQGSMKAILSHLAKHPDVPMTTEEMAEAAGSSKKALRSILGAFGNRCKNRYKIDDFCFHSEYDTEAHQRLYVMPATIAEAIRGTMAPPPPTSP